MKCNKIKQKTLTIFNALYRCYSVSRLIKAKNPSTDTSLPDCSYEFSPTDANTTGTLIYIRNTPSFKTKNELNIYKSLELGSIFIVVFNLKKRSIITECIYKYSNMNINEFNDDYL